jgi:hypothetical protein
MMNIAALSVSRQGVHSGPESPNDVLDDHGVAEAHPERHRGVATRRRQPESEAREDRRQRRHTQCDASRLGEPGRGRADGRTRTGGVDASISTPARPVGLTRSRSSAPVPVLVAGVSELAGVGGGLYWLVPAMILLLGLGIMSAWILLIEILR